MNRIFLAFLALGDTVQVIGSPDGSSHRIRPLGTFRPDARSAADAAATIERVTRLASSSGEMPASAHAEIVRAAQWLHDEYLPGEARRWLDRPTPQLVTLSLSPELLHLPWELFHDGNGFLGERHAVGRVVQLEGDTPVARDLPGRRRSILVVADPAGRLEHCYHEGMRIGELLGRDVRCAVALRTSDVDAGLLRRHLRDFDVVHFAGHIDRDGWEMAESRFDAALLERLVGGAALPALVFANGCAALRADDFDRGMLRLWLAAGVRHLIGPIHETPDRLGREFANQFYVELLAGNACGEAVRRARIALAKRFGAGSIPWGGYVLYGDPGALYFTRAALSISRPGAAPPGATLPAEDRTAVRGAMPRVADDLRIETRRTWSGAELAQAIVFALLASALLALAWLAVS